uniref:FAE domain-containing protein n=3 Tax=Zea mays TaxID=4577 RepID=A0A804MNT7_MAIZE
MARRHHRQPLPLACRHQDSQPLWHDCTAGVVGVSVARRLLLTHAAISYAVIVSTEIFIVGWYNGKDEGKLILNYYWSASLKARKTVLRTVAAMEPGMEAALIKVGMFVLVQALVYLILSQSSTVFSRTKSLGLRPARSLSARRMLALLSDLPLNAGEPSPVAAFARTRSALSPMLAAAQRKQD